MRCAKVASICRLLAAALFMTMLWQHWHAHTAAATPHSVAAIAMAFNDAAHMYNTPQGGQVYRPEYGDNAPDTTYYRDTPKHARPGNAAKQNRQPNRQTAAAASENQPVNSQPAQLHQNPNARNNLLEPNPAVVDWVQNMCKLWVPDEAVPKYPQAKVIQHDQSTRRRLIEVCCEGYGPVRWRGSTLCQPACENCRNGFCVAPGQCRCYEGFVANDNGDCVFACPLGCLNGRCYLDGSCQCDPGYKLDEMRQFCRPICNDYCNLDPKLNCTAPDVCGCAKGYRMDTEGCQPTCALDCGVGGTCREPNVCECDNGYTSKNGICQATCYQQCTNGICISQNRCICNPGYVYHERSTECIPA